MNIKNFPKVIIKIKPSTMLKGEVGLFTARSLKKGTIISKPELMGENASFSWDEFKKIDKITQETIMSFCLGNPKGFDTLTDMNYMSLPWFMNHSCDGNVGFDKNDNFITLKTVKANSELFWDYGLGETNPSFKMNCLCGSKKCRGLITGNDWKNPIFYKKNRKNMLSSLIDKKTI